MALRRFEIPNFVGGLQTKTSYLFHRENELGELVNGRVDSALGAVTRVPGYAQLGTTIAAEEIVGLFEYSKSDGTRVQIAACNGDLHTLNGSTWSAESQSISTGVQSDFTNFLDKCFWVNGTDAPRTYNGSAWLTTTSQNSDVFHAPQGHLVESRKGNVYIANKESSRLYKSSKPIEIIGIVQGDHNNTVNIQIEDTRYLYADQVVDIYKAGTSTEEAASMTISSVNDSKNTIVIAAADTLSDGAQLKLENETGSQHIHWGSKDDDYVEVDPQAGDNINAMIAGQNLLHIWKNYSYHQWNGKELKRIADQGCSSQKAVRAYSDLTFWFNQEGLWAWPGQRIQKISDGIKPEIDQVSAANLITVGLGLEGEHLLISVGDLDDISNAVIDYNIGSDTWQTLELPDEFRIFSSYVTGNKKKLIAGTTAGKIMEINSGNDFAGSIIHSRIETREIYITHPEEVKSIKQIFVFAKIWTGVDAYITTDGGRVKMLKTIKGDSGLTGAVTEFRGDWKGNYFTFGFLNSGESFEIDAIVLYYDSDEAKG